MWHLRRAGAGGHHTQPAAERARPAGTFRRRLIYAAGLVFAGTVLLAGMGTSVPDDTQRSPLADVGNNCDPICMLGALGSAFGAFGAAMGDPWGRRAAEREWNQYRHRRGEFFRDNPQRADRDEWYEQNPPPDVEAPGGELIVFTEMVRDWTEAVVGEAPSRTERPGVAASRD